MAYTFMSFIVPSVREVRVKLRVGTWMQELKQRPWGGTRLTGLFLVSYSACSPLPRSDTTHSVGPSTSVANQENDTQACLPASLLEGVLNRGSFFQKTIVSFCQVDRMN